MTMHTLKQHRSNLLAKSIAMTLMFSVGTPVVAFATEVKHKQDALAASDAAAVEAAARSQTTKAQANLPAIGGSAQGTNNAKAATDAYADPADATGKSFVVDVIPDRKLARPVTLAEIKADKSFASFPLVRMARLSVMPVTEDEWERIEKMSKT